MRVVALLLSLILIAIFVQSTDPHVNTASGTHEQESAEVYTSDLEEEIAASQPQPIKVEEVKAEPLVQQEIESPKFEQIPSTPPQSAPSKYMYEGIFVSLIFLFLLNYKTGKRANEVIADRWVQSIMKVAQEQFALIGFGEEPSHEPQGVILEQSGHQYTFYATGRQNLSFFEASFELRKREDLFSFYALEFVFPEKDFVTIDIPMDCTTPLVFCLAKKKELKNLKEKCLDLSFLTKNFDISGLNEPYRILGENSESIDFIFDGYVVKNLNQLANVVFSIHYTDQKVFTNSPGHLRLVLNANHLEPEKNEQALKIALYIVDKIANLKLPQNIRLKSDKSRQAFAATKEKENLEKKQEELQKQKAEKWRLEEQRIRHLPPEKQQKALDKLKTKELNKRLKGKVMKVM